MTEIRLPKTLISLAFMGGMLLSACEVSTPVSAPSNTVPGIDIQPQSGESRRVQSYYERVQASLLTHGLLRSDGGGPDVPYNARILAQNFLKIAFYQEYTEQSGNLFARESVSFLHRWDSTIRYNISFGASVPETRRATDQRELRSYTQRLAQLTNLRFVPATNQTNMHIFVVNEDERQEIGPRLQDILPGISPATLATVENMPRDTYCLALAASPGQSAEYAQAIIIIRGEHPDLLRRSCIHEEIAQSLGLPNDSAAARPSIFNDDGEFGLLTSHDEMLLRMLYDPRLRPGMTETEAEPIVNIIAAELLGGTV